MREGSVVKSLKVVLDVEIEENRRGFIHRVAILFEKDFLQEIYKVISYDFQDSSGNYKSFLQTIVFFFVRFNVYKRPPFHIFLTESRLTERHWLSEGKTCIFCADSDADSDGFLI